MPPKKPATAVADFSPASSLEFGLHGAASAPIPQDLAVPEEAAPVRHIMSCQDLSLDDIGRQLCCVAYRCDLLEGAYNDIPSCPTNTVAVYLAMGRSGYFELQGTSAAC